MNDRRLRDTQHLLRADRLIRVLRGALDPTVPAHLVQAFLAVAAYEGRTLEEIAEGLGSEPSATFRLLQALGDGDRSKSPGYRLVKATTDPENPKGGRYALTQRGKLLAQAVSEVLAA